MLFESKLSEIEFTPHFSKVLSNQINLYDDKLLEKFPDNYEKCRFILLDTETTGLDVNTDRLISINAVEMINKELTGIQFNAYLNKRFTNNTRPLMYYLSDYNYSRDNNIKKSLETFLSFVSDSIIITHNALFDMKFINEELKRCGLPQIPLGQCICTLKILKNLKKIGRLDKNFKLRLCDLCRYYDIDIDQKDLHQGIVDAIVFGRVVAKMLDDGIYNDYDGYDFEDANSFVNCTHADIDYNFDSSLYQINNHNNTYEEKTDSESENKKIIIRKKIVSKSKKKLKYIQNKININENINIENKKKSAEIIFNKNKNLAFFNNNMQNSRKENNNNENITNNNKKDKKDEKDENEEKDNIIKNKLYNSYILPKQNENFIKKDKNLTLSIDEINNNTYIFDKEEPKMNFLKKAFKCYIKENQQKKKK